MVHTSNSRSTAATLFTIDEDGIEEIPNSQTPRINTLNHDSEQAHDDDDHAETLQNSHAKRNYARRDSEKARSAKRTRLATTASMQGVLCEIGFAGDRCLLCTVNIVKYGGNQVRHYKKQHPEEFDKH